MNSIPFFDKITVEDKEELAEKIDMLLSDSNKVVTMGNNAEQVATSEMNVLDRLYDLMRQRGIL